MIEVHPGAISQPVGRRSWVGSDGSRIALDTELPVDAAGGACTFELAADGALRCLPLATLERSRAFSDAICSSPMLVADECAAGLFERSADDALPIPRVHVFAAGSPARARSIRVGRCVQLDGTDPRSDGFTPGNELDPALFPLGRRVEVSGSRLLVPAVEAYGALIVERFAAFFDRSFDAQCTLLTDRDGIGRCVPNRGVAAIVFADPGCSEAVGLAPAPSSGLAAEVREGRLVQLRRTTGASTLGFAFVPDAVGCQAVDGVRTLLALGEPASFDAFVAIRTVVE
jgi:hypothetical protein